MDSRPTLVVGEEDFLADQVVADLVAKALTPEDQRLNLDVIDGGAPLTEILTLLDTAPFFGPCRVVVVRRLDAMREADHEALIGFLERGGSPTTAVFVARELDRRKRLFQTFKRVATIIEVRPLPPRELPGWVTNRFTLAGKRVAPGTAESLVAFAGNNLRDLDHEVAKVAAYVGDRPLVTRADVEAIASRIGEASIFTLVDAVGGGDAAGALRALHDILSTHEPPQVLFMVARQFRLILRAHTLAGRPGTGPALAERLGLHPFVARKIAEQARGYRADQFPRIFAEIEGADRAIKTGTPSRLVLEMLFVRLCELRRRVAARRGMGAPV
ncbi:MAG: DNA polymerase III subunit delta [Armatimonadota bacterium]|nr:DNA polymerase III subunit delta [Armatimonadota bacterium]